MLYGCCILQAIFINTNHSFTEKTCHDSLNFYEFSAFSTLKNLKRHDTYNAEKVETVLRISLNLLIFEKITKMT